MNRYYRAVEAVETPSSAISKNFKEFRNSIQSVNTLYDTRINLIRNVDWKELEEIITDGTSRKYDNYKIEVRFDGNNFIAQNEAGNVIPFCPIIPCSYYPGGNTITCSHHSKEYESHWRQFVSKQQSTKSRGSLCVKGVGKTMMTDEILPRTRTDITAKETRTKPDPLELAKRVGSSINKLPVPERNKKQKRMNVKTLGDGKKPHYNKQSTTYQEVTKKMSTINKDYKKEVISAKRRMSPNNENNGDMWGALKQPRPSTSGFNKAFYSERRESVLMKSPLSSTNRQQLYVNSQSSVEIVDLVNASQSQDSDDLSISQLMHLPIQDSNISSSESEGACSMVAQDVKDHALPYRRGEENGLTTVDATNKRSKPEQQANPRDDILKRLKIYKSLF